MNWLKTGDAEEDDGLVLLGIMTGVWREQCCSIGKLSGINSSNLCLEGPWWFLQGMP